MAEDKPKKKGKHGGRRPNQTGRPPKAVEEHKRAIFLAAIRKITSNEDDQEAQIEFVHKIATQESGGLKWVGDQFFGKAKEIKDVTSGGEVISFIPFIEWVDGDESDIGE